MKVWIDSEERYPFWTLSDKEIPYVHPSFPQVTMELTSEEAEEYANMVLTFEKWQLAIDNYYEDHSHDQS